MKLFIPMETPFIFCTIYQKWGSYHYVYKNIDSSNKVDSVDCTVAACASLRQCAPIRQRLAQTSQQFDSNQSLSHGFTTQEGHLTELLLVKMTDDWRRALANNKTVRIIFLTIKMRFIPYSSGLLQELQGIKIARDILLWMKDYTVYSSNSNILNTMRNTLKHTLPLFLNCLFFNILKHF